MKRKEEPGRRERLPGDSLLTRQAAKFVGPGSETRILGMPTTLCGARRMRGQGALPKVKPIGIQKALFAASISRHSRENEVEGKDYQCLPQRSGGSPTFTTHHVNLLKSLNLPGPQVLH